MAFKAKIIDVLMFPLPSHEGLVLQLNHVEGEPRKGDRVRVGARVGTLVEIQSRGLTDRSCLTGQPVPRHGAIFVDFGDLDLNGLSQAEINGGDDV